MKNFWLDRLKNKFPQDDALSLIQGCNGSAILDFYYEYQFVSNEWLQARPSPNCQTNFVTAYTPVLKGSMIGTIFLNSRPIQTFIHNANGEIDFQDHLPSTTKVLVGRLLPETGELILYWNFPPTDCKVEASYEYNYCESLNRRIDDE